EKILDRVRKIKIGHPLDPATNMGPINNKAQYQKALFYIDLGKKHGARLLHGGGIPKGDMFARGYWVEPTVFGDVTMSMRLAQEEVFGPVMSILKFKTEAEAIDMANGIELGLTAAVWANDINRALRVAQAAEAGDIWLDGVVQHYRGLPVGGCQ